MTEASSCAGSDAPRPPGAQNEASRYEPGLQSQSWLALARLEPVPERGADDVGGVVLLVVAEPDGGHTGDEEVEAVRPPVVFAEGFEDVVEGPVCESALHTFNRECDHSFTPRI